MKRTLQIGLLGTVQFNRTDQPIGNRLPRKGEAILSYLAVRQMKLPRQTLATLFWQDLREEDARRNLRGVIMKLRQVIHPFLEIDADNVGLVLDDSLQIDLQQFELARRKGTIQSLETAVRLIRGEFMAGFYLRDAAEFESWQQQERTRIHQLVLQTYDQLLMKYEASGKFETGIQLARQLIEIEPTREASHRYLIRFLAHNNWVDAAVDQFEAMRTLLEKELQVEVSPESRQLLDTIRRQNLSGSLPTFVNNQPGPTISARQEEANHSAASVPFIAGPPITKPINFFGREAIIKRLFGLFQKRPFQNAAIIGPRRSGKTSLLHYVKSITTAPADQRRPEQRTNWLPDPDHYRWVFVDFQDARFGERSRLLSHMLTQMHLSAPPDCSLDDFLDIVTDELEQPTLILLDEIGVALSRYQNVLDDSFWESLRSLATNQVDGKMGFILSSHQQPYDLAQHNGYGSPFFNIFGYTAVLGPLQETAAICLIQSAPIAFPKDDVNWILAQSQLWPMPLQILCRECLISLTDGTNEAGWREAAFAQASPFLPRASI